MSKVKLAFPMLPEMEIEASKAAMAVAESMSMSPDRIDEVGMAVVEACINALEHSQSSEDVRVTLEVIGDQDPEKLRITVRDHGVGFSVEDAEPEEIPETTPKLLQKRRWGLTIIRKLMDEVEIHSGPGGTTLVMSKMR